MNMAPVVLFLIIVLVLVNIFAYVFAIDCFKSYKSKNPPSRFVDYKGNFQVSLTVALLMSFLLSTFIYLNYLA